MIDDITQRLKSIPYPLLIGLFVVVVIGWLYLSRSGKSSGGGSGSITEVQPQTPNGTGTGQSEFSLETQLLQSQLDQLGYSYDSLAAGVAQNSTVLQQIQDQLSGASGGSTGTPSTPTSTDDPFAGVPTDAVLNQSQSTAQYKTGDETDYWNPTNWGSSTPSVVKRAYERRHGLAYGSAA